MSEETDGSEHASSVSPLAFDDSRRAGTAEEGAAWRVHEVLTSAAVDGSPPTVVR